MSKFFLLKIIIAILIFSVSVYLKESSKEPWTDLEIFIALIINWIAIFPMLKEISALKDKK